MGEVVTLTGSEAAVVCLEGGAEGAEFTHIPFLAVPEGSRTLTIRASGLGAPPDAPPARDAAHDHGAPAGAHDGWERRFREQEQRELFRIVPGASLRGEVHAASRSADANWRVAIVRTR